MDCKEVKKLLYLYFDCEINQGRLKRLKKHLLDCPRCRLLEGSIKKTIDLLSSLKREELNPDLIERVMQRIRNQRIELEIKKAAAIDLLRIFSFARYILKNFKMEIRIRF